VRGFLNYWRNLLTTFHGIEKGVCGKIKGKKSHPQHPIFTRLGVQLFPSLSLSHLSLSFPCECVP